VILINRGTFRGHDGVRELAGMLGEELPEHRSFEYTYRAVEGRMAFLEWAYEDANIRVRGGADSYLIEEGKIVAQTIHYTVEQEKGAGPQVLRCRSGQQPYQALYRGERAAQQEPDPNEAFAAVLSEPNLPNPKHYRPEAEHHDPHAPRPEDYGQDRGPYEQDHGR
jgi:hypothetical protein